MLGTFCPRFRLGAWKPLSDCLKIPLQSQRMVSHRSEVCAVYNPGFGSNEGYPRSNRNGLDPLHGVFLRTDLPDSLSESISVFDARDAIETCSGLWGEEKDACYAIFGVDPGAEAWFDTVYMLEENLALETDVQYTFEPE